MTEYYAPKSRQDAEEVEAKIWPIIKDRFGDNTECWAKPVEHPITGKFGIILPEDWEDYADDIGVAEVDIQTQEQMEAAGWFPRD
jgi:hypothetical protein